MWATGEAAYRACGAMTASIIKQWPIKKKYNNVFNEYFDKHQGFIWDDTWPNSHLDKSVTKFTVLNIITATIAVFCVQINSILTLTLF